MDQGDEGTRSGLQKRPTVDVIPVQDANGARRQWLRPGGREGPAGRQYWRRARRRTGRPAGKAAVGRRANKRGPRGNPALAPPLSDTHYPCTPLEQVS